jgi:hypothetical protein
LHLCFCPWWLERDRLLDPELLKEDSDVEDSNEDKEHCLEDRFLE